MLARFNTRLLLLSDAFDTEMLLSSMEKLRHGQAVDIPNYDFKSHKSTESSQKVLQASI